MHIYRKNLLIIITLCLLLATIFTKDIGVDAKHTDNSLLVSHQKTSTKSADKEYVTPKKIRGFKTTFKGRRSHGCKQRKYIVFKKSG